MSPDQAGERHGRGSSGAGCQLALRLAGGQLSGGSDGLRSRDERAGARLQSGS